MFGKAVAGILTAVQDYAQHKEEKGEPVPEILSQPINRRTSVAELRCRA